MNYKDYTSMNDLQIIDGIKNGDLDGIVYLYLKYQAQIKALSKKYFLENEEPDDLFQIASIGFIKSIASFKPDYNVPFITYSKRCMNNIIIDYIRKSTSIKNTATYKHESIYNVLNEDEGIYLVDMLQDDNSPDPERLLLEKEAYEMFNMMCESMNLSNIEKRIILLKSQDKKQKEIASELCMDIRSVDNALQRIKRRFSKFDD